MVRTEVAEPPATKGTDVKLRETPRRDDDGEAVRDAFPVRPTLLMRMFEVPDLDEAIVTVVGLVDTVKFPVTKMVSTDERTIEPLVALTIIR